MVPLYVLMHGLIALVPLNEADGVNHMTALLVDATKQPVEMKQCWEAHIPELTVATETSAECFAAGCTFEGLVCVCKATQLKRRQVTLAISTGDPGKRDRFTERPAASVPFDQLAAVDFAYVPNLAKPPINAPLNRAFLDDSSDAKQIVPVELYARLTFPFENVFACTPAVRPDEGATNVYPFGFRPLFASEKAGELNQAVAQQAVAVTQLPDDAKVVLTISDLDGGNPKTLNVIQTTNQVTNLPEFVIRAKNSRAAHYMHPDELCDDGVGRDFAFFYNLVQNPPAWKDRSLPHIKYSRWKSEGDVLNEECTKHPDFAMTSRPICAMASFN